MSEPLASAGRRWPRRLLIAGLVLLGPLLILLAVADRYAVGVAQSQIASQVTAQLADDDVTANPPKVDVRGYPFLTQVLAGHYPDVHIELDHVTAKTSDVTLDRLDLVADVRATLAQLRGGGPVTADRVQATTTVGYDSVAALAGMKDLKLSEEKGRLIAVLPLDLLGQRVTVRGVGRLEPDGDKIRIRFDELTVQGGTGGPALANAIKSYAEQMGVDVPLPSTPFALKVTAVRPQPDGLRVTAEARNVTLR